MKLPTGGVRRPEDPGGRPARPAVGAADAGMLLLRLAVGLILAGHGARKLFGWFDGRGLDGAGRGFSQFGWDPGVFYAGLAGAAELLGGLGLAAGLLTPLSAAACIGVMAGAMALAPEISLWPAAGTAFVYPMVLAAGALTVAAVGPLRLSLDARLPWRDGGWAPAGFALVLGLAGAFVVLALR
ncbi:DoxX family protein [Streptomyces pacificus]|uniref:DoxX family protein n=1 Tax=Streptomyces pacificus TaxID=2705029 RepID=A0A6A0ATW5_9ACTN|nr:DoxX family protein [Streptomyces pacificus]GFH36409.1 DoxX family protein [Streptomyces pacificus]